MGVGFGWTVKGDFNKIYGFFKKIAGREYLSELDILAMRGVEALRSATPVETGRTAASWQYEIDESGGNTSIRWYNTNVTRDGEPIAIMLQYGHGTGTGGYVQGRDYINPAIRPIFEEISNRVGRAISER